MSKYRDRGPYHFIDYASGKSAYFHHVRKLVEMIQEHFLVPPRVHEVGCGEGMILQVLRNMGCQVTGNDIDPEAVRMAELIHGKGIVILLGHIECEKVPRNKTDLILFSDSLEHIEKWREHLEWAKIHALHVLIAVPSERDKHAINKLDLGSFDEIMQGWKKIKSFTANKRHVLFFCNDP